MTTKYKIVIPTAGLGSRLKSLSKHVNKALVTIANKPSISYVVEKFPADVEIVVALGYKKETVRDFLKIAYPDRRFTFVEVDPFEGEGSGLGLSLLKCKPYLQCPFIFCSNDTIVTEEIPAPEMNWMGFADIADTEQYRSIRFEPGQLVTEICSKGATGNVRPYVGLAGIKDFGQFWTAMEEGVGIGSIEIGESYGLRFLIDKGIKPLKFTWFDTGNIDALQKSRAHFGKEAGPNILEKEEEAIWFVKNRVIKFSVDKSFIKNRIQRSKSLGSYIPELLSESENLYSYRKVEGEEMAKHPTAPKFSYFLQWITGFWKPAELSLSDTESFHSVCLDFYRDKTLKRVKQYFTRFEQLDSEEVINGIRTPRLSDILAKIDWGYVAKGIPVRFHGDLHFENILIRSGGTPPFCLLDWRQDFGGLLEYGDIYYDFAKLLHGLMISHELITQNQFNVDHTLNHVEFDFLRKNSLVECEAILKHFVTSSGYEWKKVELLTALVFLNIAPLHHYPYTKLLFYLGKRMLNDLVEDPDSNPTK